MQKLYFQLGSDKWVRIHQAGGREKESVPAETDGGENQHIMKDIMKPAKSLSYISGK